MRAARLFGILLRPSLLSTTVAILLAFIIISGAVWSYITPDSAVHEYLFGPYGLATILEGSSNALSAVNGAFNSPSAYNVAVAVFALLIGLLVFVFLQGVDHVAYKTNEALQEVEYVSDAAAKKQVKRQALIRLSLRVATLLIWTIYLILFARIVVPFCILVARPDTTISLWDMQNVLSGFEGTALLVVALHVHVILMRLLVLRPRLFGGEWVGRGGH